MKVVIQKGTGLDEQVLIEVEGAGPLEQDVQDAFKIIDARLWQTNRKIVEAREFISKIPSPHYRYMFTAFLDGFLGVSSQAEPLLRKFGVDAPDDYDKWYHKRIEKKEKGEE